MLQNYNGYRILELFMNNPTYPFSWTEISTKLKLAPVSVKQYIDILIREKMIISKKFKKTKLYQANRENQEFKDNKIFYNIRKLRNSGLIEYLDETMNYPTITLYGSSSKGEDIESSDIDLTVICLKNTDIKIEEFERKLGKTIQIIIIEKKEISKFKEKNKELITSISNGIVLSGFLEVI